MEAVTIGLLIVNVVFSAVLIRLFLAPRDITPAPHPRPSLIVRKRREKLKPVVNDDEKIWRKENERAVPQRAD